MAIILLTFVLFVFALFTKGFFHDLFLEAGVFLVSVKLIMLAYRSNIMKETIVEKLDIIHAAIVRLEEDKSASSSHVPRS